MRGTPPALCGERAILVTRYFRSSEGKGDPTPLRKAGALAYVLANKRVCIYPRELLVGNFTARRVGGGLFPELHGVAMLEDLFRFPRRRVNPLVVSKEDRRRLLLEVLPYWAPRIMGLKALPFLEELRFLAEQANPKFHLVNEFAGVSHFVPDYEGLLARGTRGIREEASLRGTRAPEGSESAHFLRAVDVACAGLERFADRYAREAARLAAEEADGARRGELEGIAAACGRVPRLPARTFREALQSLLFAQIALNLESLDNSVSPGRLDQVLRPYYERDVTEGRLSPSEAYELLGCFAVKLCEIVPAFSLRGSRFHGGMFNGQVVVVGGTDRPGGNAVSELTYLFLDLMDELRTRQPNYHARIHPSNPAGYRNRIARALAAGAVSPALYNDEVIVPLLESRGIPREEARDYANVGCVEPVVAAKSFFSTDAALLNLPLCLELALNRGRRFGGWGRRGASTPPVEGCRSIEEVVDLFRVQVAAAVSRLLRELRGVERANARFHPTPLTSALLRGCIDRGIDASAGGALYNASGIQGVGVVEVGESLAALESVVFRDRRATMREVVRALKRNFRSSEPLRARLRSAPKYGNDVPEADRWVGRVMEVFGGALRGEKNTRGGSYAAGYYSVTSHVAFGKVVGALPSGRLAGEPYSSGISPTNGMDRRGPTAALLSQAALPLGFAQNGVNFNLQLDPWIVAGEEGAERLRSLVDGAFAAGCMQMQVNVLDPKVLLDARDHPGRYPGLLVRVSGYSAYFDDLSPEMKQEIIHRTLHGKIAS